MQTCRPLHRRPARFCILELHLPGLALSWASTSQQTQSCSIVKGSPDTHSGRAKRIQDRHKGCLQSEEMRTQERYPRCNHAFDSSKQLASDRPVMLMVCTVDDIVIGSATHDRDDACKGARTKFSTLTRRAAWEPVTTFHAPGVSSIKPCIAAVMVAAHLKLRRRRR